MELRSSQISLTSKVQSLCFNGYKNLPNGLNEVISRLAALCLSPAAVIDLTIHTLALPCTFVYAIGKSVYNKSPDFILPWQHLQRIRETAFPIIFGSIFGLIHPYLGIFVTEPTRKHIAAGYLLSNSKNTNFDVLISPISAYQETIDNIKITHFNPPISPDCLKMTNMVLDWEKSLESVQGLQMFDFKITSRVMCKIYSAIDNHLTTSLFWREVLYRISLVIYPIFAAIDFTAGVAISAFFFTAGVIQLIGGKAPSYLESTSSPIFHIYQIAKIILSGLGLVAGFTVSFVSPDWGIKLSYPSSNKLGLVPLLQQIQFLKLKRQIKNLEPTGKILLPIIQNHSESNAILPSVNSHMLYLLIQRQNQEFRAELIERGEFHGSRNNLSEAEVFELAKKCLALRFSSRKEDQEILNEFGDKFGLLDLGTQSSLKNCVITNLFATFEVINYLSPHIPTIAIDPSTFKRMIAQKYNFYLNDFFPFGNMQEVVKEIMNLEDVTI